MYTLLVLSAALILVAVYILLRRVTGPAEQDLRRRANENAQELLEHRRKQNDQQHDQQQYQQQYQQQTS